VNGGAGQEVEGNKTSTFEHFSGRFELEAWVVMGSKGGEIGRTQRDPSLEGRLGVDGTDEAAGAGGLRDVLYLHLLEHCIETSARHAHRACMDRLLVEEADDLDIVDDQDGQDARDVQDDMDRLGAELELLEAFLKSHDFRALRAGDADLAGGRDVWVAIGYGPDGSATFEKLAGPPDGHDTFSADADERGGSSEPHLPCERE